MFTLVVLDNFTERIFQSDTTFVIKTRAEREPIVFPRPGPTFQLEKKAYVEKYGPYSFEHFEEIMKDLIDNFMATKRMRTNQGIIRRIWLLTQFYNLFEGSMGLLVHGKPNLLAHAITKALEVLRDPTVEHMMEDRSVSEYTRCSIAKSLKTIEIVYTKIADIVTSNANLLKLLPTTSLLSLVEYATNKMVSGFRRLPWIDPIVVNRVLPKFNSYWRNFWHLFFAKNFDLDDDICFVIAEFMPMNFTKEPFLDFFCRKYDVHTREFFGKRLFDVEQMGNIINITIN